MLNRMAMEGRVGGEEIDFAVEELIFHGDEPLGDANQSKIDPSPGLCRSKSKLIELIFKVLNVLYQYGQINTLRTAGMTPKGYSQSTGEHR
jgi:hypothetical protein